CRPRDGCQVGVNRDACDSQVGRPERRARVESHPAEEQNERPRDYVNKIVRGKNTNLAVPLKLSDSWSKNDGEGHRTESTYRVNHTRSSEIDISMSQIHGRPELREPASSPSPASEDRIEKRTDKYFAQEE